MNLSAKRTGLSSKTTKEIYFSAFSENERMPFGLMVLLSLLPTTKFTTYYDEDKAVGFLYFGIIFGVVFVMFFAVDENLRSKGYGSEIIKMLSEKYPKKKIILSTAESAETGSSLSARKRFYLRNGFSETGYTLKINGIEEEVLIKNGEFSPFELRLFFFLYSFGTLYPKISKIKTQGEL